MWRGSGARSSLSRLLWSISSYLAVVVGAVLETLLTGLLALQISTGN